MFCKGDRQEAAPLGEEFEEVAELCGIHLFLEALRHEGEPGSVKPLEVFPQDDMLGALGIVDLQGVAVFRGQQAGEDLSLAGNDGVLPEVTLDTPVGIEDVNQQLLLGVDG